MHGNSSEFSGNSQERIWRFLFEENKKNVEILSPTPNKKPKIWYNTEKLVISCPDPLRFNHD
jgi:hypothetical protein